MNIQDNMINVKIDDVSFNFDKEMEEINKLIDEMNYYEKKNENIINQTTINFFIFLCYFVNNLNFKEKRIIEYEKYFYSSSNLYYQYINLLDFLVRIIVLYCQSHNYPK